MEDFDAYAGLPLRGGFLLKSVRQEDVSMTDALNRPASARTVVIGITLEVEPVANLSAEEISVTLYHEVLEAAAVAVQHPPTAVCELNETGFESSRPTNARGTRNRESCRPQPNAGAFRILRLS